MAEISADCCLYTFSSGRILIIFECIIRAQILAHFIEYSKAEIIEDTRLLIQLRA